jgi:N-acyl amino acid synthase of PEP-CTERM/exosortase system
VVQSTRSLDAIGDVSGSGVRGPRGSGPGTSGLHGSGARGSSPHGSGAAARCTDLYEAFTANFEVLVADTPDLVTEALALRYQVYCVERGYEDPALNPGGCERDEFDRRSVHGLVHHRASGRCVGAVRLILADAAAPARAFPAEVHCKPRFYPGVAERVEAIPRLQLAEISRFAVSKDFRRRLSEAEYTHGISPHASYFDSIGTSPEHRRFMPQVTIGLFAAVVRLSATHGVTHWFAVMEPTLLRLLQRFGIYFPPIGPVVEYHGRRRPTLAIAAEVTERARHERPDVWQIVTDWGEGVPPFPRAKATPSL